MVIGQRVKLIRPNDKELNWLSGALADIFIKDRDNVYTIAAIDKGYYGDFYILKGYEYTQFLPKYLKELEFKEIFNVIEKEE